MGGISGLCTITHSVYNLPHNGIENNYSWLEKRTQNELIRKFIEKLRHNHKIRFIMLVPFSYILTCLSFSLISLEFSFGISSAFYFISLFFGSAGNYLFLFFYWFVVDLYKKKKQNNNKI